MIVPRLLIPLVLSLACIVVGCGGGTTARGDEATRLAAAIAVPDSASGLQANGAHYGSVAFLSS
jgi:hypothetical protein